MKSVKYLDMAIERLQLKNDFSLSKHLNWSRGIISMYRSGKRVMDDEACLAIALLLDMNPMEIIGAACIDRAEKSGQSSLWEVFMSRTAGATASALILAAVTLFLTSPDGQAANMRPANQSTSGNINYANGWWLVWCCQQPHPIKQAGAAAQHPTLLAASASMEAFE